MNRLRLIIFTALTIVFVALSLTLAHGYNLSHFWRNTAIAGLIQTDNDPRDAMIDCAASNYVIGVDSGGWPLAWHDDKGPLAFPKGTTSMGCPGPSSRVNVVALVIDLAADVLLAWLVSNGVGMIIDRKSKNLL